MSLGMSIQPDLPRIKKGSVIWERDLVRIVDLDEFLIVEVVDGYDGVARETVECAL